jgi:ribonuclease HI
MNYNLIDKLCKLYNIKQIKGKYIPLLSNYKFITKLNNNNTFINNQKNVLLDICESYNLDPITPRINIGFSKKIYKNSYTIAQVNKYYLYSFSNYKYNIDIKNILNESNIKVINKFNPLDKDEFIYTDASIKNNKCGLGIWFPNIPKYYKFNLNDYIDNNYGELYAIYLGCLFANKQFILYTDSLTSIELIHNKIHNIKYNNIVSKIQNILYFKKGIIIKIKSHSGDENNDIADFLAKSATSIDIDPSSL